ncbi:MAG: HTTM domain-containing protein [Chitinophagales bacterium]|nr:HTTM domain-containing protein [Bacteroidota bacterium]
MQFLKNCHFENPFTFDARALAVFRISLGVIILADLFLRTLGFKLFHTDLGLLPLDGLYKVAWKDWYFSVYTISGSPMVVGILFALAAVLAVLLILGYRTRLVTALSWFMLVSLHMRNPAVLQGADVVLRLLLFWSIFMPLGCVWSLDALRKKEPSPNLSVFNGGTVAYILQIVIIYFFTGILKDGTTWQEGTAIYYALQNDHFSTKLGHWVSHFSSLTYLINYGTLILEIYGPLLLFIPFCVQRVRTLVVPLFVLMHLSFIFLMYIGLFPWISIICWIPFFPNWVWDKFPQIGYFLENIFTKIYTYFPQPLSYTPNEKWVKIKKIAANVASIIALYLIALVALWNFNYMHYITMPDALKPTVRQLRLDQKWSMFAPNPPRADGWFVVRGNLADGSTVDLLQDGASFTEQRPKWIYDHFPTPQYRWRKYLTNIISKSNKGYRMYLGKYYCKCWNTYEKRMNTPQELQTLTVIYMREQNLPDFKAEAPVEKVLWNHWCKPEYKKLIYKDKTEKEIEQDNNGDSVDEEVSDN